VSEKQTPKALANFSSWLEHGDNPASTSLKKINALVP
jgi:hypothetical protein